MRDKDMSRAAKTFGCFWVVAVIVNIVFFVLIVYGIWVAIQALQKYIAS
jgi:uncharacterized protein YneF (UPF0154 family)